jgi:hypothetical protein
MSAQLRQLREKLTELEVLEQRANKLTGKTGKTNLSRTTLVRILELIGFQEESIESKWPGLLALAKSDAVTVEITMEQFVEISRLAIEVRALNALSVWE